MSVSRYAVLCMVILLLARGVPVAADEVTAKERDLAGLYAGYSYDAFAEGNYGEAGRLLDVALVFDPGNADALAVSALLQAGEGNLEASLALFEKAAAMPASGSDRRVDEELLRRRMAETAFRLGSPERAYLYLLPLTTRVDLPVETGVLLVDILDSLGRSAEARRTAAELASRNPGSSEAVAAFMEMDPAFVPPFLVHPPDPEAAVEKLSGYGSVPVRMIYLRTFDPDLRRLIADKYREWFGEDLFWYFTEGVGLVSTTEERAALVQNSLKLFPPSTRDELLFHRSLLREEELRDVFDGWFAGFTGSIEGDWNGDGFTDTVERYENGVLSEYLLDRDQNGAYELEVVFRGGVPEKVVRGAVSYVYSDYPYLKTFTVSDETRIVEYTLYPFVLIHRISFEPLLARTLSAERPPVEENAPSEERVAARALSVNSSVVEGSESISLRRPFAGGAEYRIESPDEGSVREQRSDDGMFVIRERDPDRDGRYQIRERYLDGTLIELSYDEDLDGNYEYAESYGERLVFLWDLNDDGLYDCREFLDETGGRIREVSTRLDGVFDYRTEVSR